MHARGFACDEICTHSQLTCLLAHCRPAVLIGGCVCNRISSSGKTLSCFAATVARFCWTTPRHDLAGILHVSA